MREPFQASEEKWEWTAARIQKYALSNIRWDVPVFLVLNSAQKIIRLVVEFAFLELCTLPYRNSSHKKERPWPTLSELLP
jgi:hypothetical protein